jgi:DNA-binding phage protein
LSEEKVKQLREQVAAGANKTKLAEEFDISRETLYQYLKPSGEGSNKAM